MPASASDDPINLKKPRRETASTSSDAPFGNSRCIISRKSALPASSSRLRQNSGPFFFSISERTCTRSSLSFLLGQTGSRCLFLFSSLINPVSSLRDLLLLHRCPGTSVPGFHIPPLRGWITIAAAGLSSSNPVTQAKSQELTANG